MSKPRSVYRNYISDALRTESPYEPVIGRVVLDPSLLRLLHASLGLSTEVGELVDVVKKAVFYGKPVDKVNLKEECGDLLWYVALVMAYLGETDFTDTMRINIDKLRIRYPHLFTEDNAVSRDLPAERQVLTIPSPSIQ